MADLVIRGAQVVTGAGEPIAAGGVAVRGGRIFAVGPDAALPPGREVIEAAGAILMPGLINTHCHIASTLFRGLVEDLPLEPWLQTVWKAEAAILTPETTHLGSLLGLAEMALAGVTTVLDMWWHPEATVKAARDVGLRIATGGIVFDGPGVTGETPADRLAFADRFCRDHAGAEDVIACVLPHAAYTVSPPNLIAARRVADQHDAILSLHAAETAAEVAGVEAQHGARVIPHLDKLGFLGERTILAHCVHLAPAEIELLAWTGTHVAHNPVSNLKLASGIAPVPAMLAAGVNVSLGTDGAVSGNDLDPWLALRLAAMLHRGATGDAAAVGRAQALAMATQAGARALGREGELGTLEPGKRADMVLLDVSAPHALPLFDPVTHLVFSAAKSDVRHVWVGGRAVVRDRALTGVSMPEIAARIRALAPRVAGSIR
jgi:5-methylthioadenosine/S-adenosylhomocysteine deaminase